MKHLQVHIPIPLALIAIILSTVTGCSKGTQPEQGKDTTEQAVVIGPENFAIVSQQRIMSGPVISGTLVPKDRATMRSQITGAVLSTFAEQGERVGRGALLARIDARAMGDAVASAQSALASAQSALALAKRDYQRLDTLYNTGAIPRRDLDNAERAVIGAQAGVAQAQAQLASARKQLSITQINAPLSGVVSQKLVSTGDIVQPGSAMYTIVDPSSMELEASISADQVEVIKPGSSVQFTVTGYADRTFTGVVKRVNPTVDPVTRQVKVFVEIPNSAGTLLGDLFAEGRVTTESRNALSVPTSAIDRRMMKPSVMKLDGGRVKKVQVTLGIVDELTDRIEIVSGVAQGDTLLIGPALQMTEGTLVRTSASTSGAAAPTTKGAK
jgi:RND family efflux transporter MFP subunit